MSLIQRSFLFILLLIVGLISMLLWIDYVADSKTTEANLQILKEQTYQNKKEFAKEVVATVHQTIDKLLMSEYLSSLQKVTTISRYLEQTLPVLPLQERCQILSHINTLDIKANLVKTHSNITLCASNFPLFIKSNQNLDKEAMLMDRDIVKVSKIDDVTSVIIQFPKETMYFNVQQQASKIIREMTFALPDMYVWVNEVIDYKGGDGYAVRRVHPNLPQTEGAKLSTMTKDVQGNLPYLEELEGINKEGEAIFTYYFKKKTTNEIRKKMAYAKLFKPFNWIIATGIYIDDIESIVNKQYFKVIDIKKHHDLFLYIISLLLAIVMLVLAFLLQRQYLKALRKTVEAEEHEKRVFDYQQVLYSLLDMVEKRDSYTAGHSQRVAQYAILIAEAMNLSKKEKELLYETAIMHDIGKVVTPDTILLKPGGLSQHEYSIIKEHVISGYEILDSIEAFKGHAKIMLEHHERYDGTGYPNGLSGDEISPLSHILILADAFDAMTTDRIYRPSKSLDTALLEIEELKGKQFDPFVVNMALPILRQSGILASNSQYPEGYIESERFAYYFRDALTGAYSYKYLTHLLNLAAIDQNIQYRCCYVIALRNFNTYNKTYGWIEGDQMLANIVSELKKMYPDSLIFRVYGDDFLVLHQEHVIIQKEDILSLESFHGSILDVSILHMDLKEEGVNAPEGIVSWMDSFLRQSLLY